MTENQTKISKSEAIAQLWKRGNLSWKLKSNQKEMYTLFYSSPHKTQTWLLSRRSGKTYTLCLLSIEACIKDPNTIVKFVAPTKLQVDTILRPIMREILKDCPDNISPSYSKKDYVYYFNNGSEIQLAGSEAGHAEKLRGGSSNIGIIDEAQDVTDLDNIVKSILLPTTLTTKGKIILSGTPPKDLNHDFVRFIEESESRNTLTKKTIYDNPMISEKDLEDIIVEVGGKDSEAFKREFLCELLKDSSSSVIPEFNEELEKKVVKEWIKPPFYTPYVAMDLGFKDLTVVLFAYYDFKKDKVIIEDEISMKGSDENFNLAKLTELIDEKENILWTNIYTNEVFKPGARVSDINYIVTSEISKYSGGKIHFTNARKDDKQAAINNLRLMLKNEKIIIDPKCKTLIRHLKNVKWDKSKNNNSSLFARDSDNGHYDAVDATLYLTRAVEYRKNPYPANYNTNLKDLYGPIADKQQDSYIKNNQNQIEVFKKIFNVKPRK